MKARSRSISRVVAAALSLALIAGACGGDDGDSAGGSDSGSNSSDQKAVEATVRAAVEAENNQEVDAFLALWTDKGLEDYDSGTREELQEDAEGFGEDKGEIVEFKKTTVTGETASTEVIGVQSEFNVVQPLFLLSYDLVKQGEKWLIDGFEYKGSPEPEAGTEVIDIKGQDYAFLLDTTEAPTDTAFTFENVGKEQHEITLFKGPDGVDIAAATKALGDVKGFELDNVPDGYEVDHVAFAEPGETVNVTFKSEFEAGTYVLACYIPQGGLGEEGPINPEGKPHIQLGMINTITVK